VTGQTLAQILKCYRIGDPAGAYPIFDATGSKLYPGRWNTPGSPMIYTSEHYSTAQPAITPPIQKKQSLTGRPQRHTFSAADLVSGAAFGADGCSELGRNSSR
jgi:RES domain-containing protein